MFFRRIVCLSMFFLAACQPLGNDEELENLQAELDLYGTEAAQIREGLQVDLTQVAVTIDAAMQSASAYGTFNESIGGTARAVLPPTPVISVVDNSSGPMPLEMFDLSDGQMRFVQIGVASTINVSDRCFVSHQTFFNPMDTQVIYLVALGLNVQPGTNLRGVWQIGGDIVYETTEVIQQFQEGRCVAMEFRQSDAAFTPGDWTATLFINGQPRDPAPFSINPA